MLLNVTNAPCDWCGLIDSCAFVQMEHSILWGPNRQRKTPPPAVLERRVETALLK